MAFWNRSKPYFVDKPIVAFTTGVEAPFSVTLQSLDFGLNYTDFPEEPSKKSYPGGHFIVKETETTTSGSSTYYRFLPAAKITSVELAVSNNMGIVTFTAERVYQFTEHRDKPNTPFQNSDRLFSVVNFINGELKEVYTYHNLLALQSIDYRNKKITFIDTVFDSDALNSGIASFLNTTYSTNSPLSLQNYYLIRAGYLRPIVQRPMSGTPQAGVQEIYYQMELLTSSILGIHEHSLDFTDVPTIDVAVISKAAGVYANNLPYHDPQLLYAFQSTLNPRTSF